MYSRSWTFWHQVMPLLCEIKIFLFWLFHFTFPSLGNMQVACTDLPVGFAFGVRVPVVPVDLGFHFCYIPVSKNAINIS